MRHLLSNLSEAQGFGLMFYGAIGVAVLALGALGAVIYFAVR